MNPELSDIIGGLVREAVDKGCDGDDLTEYVFSEFLQAFEKGLGENISYIKTKYPDFLEDPNPIINNVYPEIDRTSSTNPARMNAQDLTRRNPYSPEEKQVLADSKVGYLGFGGIQESALLLCRDGVGSFVLADHDTFEPTNGNRQALCLEDTLQKNKARVGAEYLQKINPEVKTRIHEMEVRPENLRQLYEDVDILVDGSGDISIRRALHEFRREARIPVYTWAWAGHEGQCLLFEPEDPNYLDAFSYSPYSDSRGFNGAGLGMLNSYIALDIERYLLGKNEYVTRYPKTATFNTQRSQSVMLRDAHALKQHNEAN